MLKRIQVSNYRCLYYIDVYINEFCVLVGPNASGKTSLLEVVDLLGRLLNKDPNNALLKYGTSYYDIVWNHNITNNINIAIEANIPKDLMNKLNEDYNSLRYELSIGLSPSTDTIVINHERVLLFIDNNYIEEEELTLFPRTKVQPTSIFAPPSRAGFRSTLTKSKEGNAHYYSEVREKPGQGYFPSIKLGLEKSTLANLPADEETFPVTTWFKNIIQNNIKSIFLDSNKLKIACPPNVGTDFLPDGSNLAWIIEKLKRNNMLNYKKWIEHVQTALPDIKDINTVIRDDDKHCYMSLLYTGNLTVPSWQASDGTLRLLALTILPYLTDFKGFYLIEEPENGIHPQAVDTVIQSLSSVYDSQVFIATHSPTVLSEIKLENLLCFAKDKNGATDIIYGNKHPRLKKWRDNIDPGALLASGILG